MRKNTKQVLLIILALIVVVSICTILACCDDPNVPSGPSVNPGGDDPSDSGNGSNQTVDAPEDGIEKVDYKITIKLPNGSPVVGVEVLLYDVDDESSAYAGATTGTDGIAHIKAGKGLEYFIVIKDIPDGYLYEDEVSVYINETEKVVFLTSANASDTYQLTVKTTAGMPLEKVSVTLKDGDNTIGKKATNEKGLASIRAAEKKAYTIELSDLPKGYSVVSELVTSSENAVQDILVESSVIQESMPSNYRYEMDDIMYDFTVTTSDGNKFTLSEALETYDFVMLNFWATWCIPCRAEFEAIQKSYELYQDKMAIIALSMDDTLSEVASFKSGYSPKLTFDMASDNNKTLYSSFSAYHGGAVPLTVFVDRYGKVSNFIKGGGREALFKQQFALYTSDEYVQVVYDPANDIDPPEEIIKPDVDMPSSESIVSAINKDGFDGKYVAENDGITWPWILNSDNELVPGNIRHNNTNAIISYNFKLKEGEFLTFDYFTNTEDVGNADLLTAYIDGSPVKLLDRLTNDKWTTIYLYTPLSATVDAQDSEIEHTLMLVYAKDGSDGFLSGDERVAIKNMRKVEASAIEGDVNILRDAAWNYNKDIKQWTKYITPVFNEVDGYYHVGSADGPYLLANLCSGTRYSSLSVSEYSTGGFFTMAGIESLSAFITTGLTNPPADSYVESAKGYSWFATYSSIENYTLVDKRLKTTLDQMCKNLAKCEYQGNKLAQYYTENSWLEICSYYDNYNGEKIENPLIGISDKEAIVAKDGGVANHVVVDRVLVPRGISFRYDCTVSGAYRVYSVLPKEYIGKHGAYVYIAGEGVRASDDAISNFDVYVTFEAGKSYFIYVAFDLPDTLGELDFYIEKMGDSYDRFTFVSTGMYTWLIDDKGNPVLDKNGDYIYVLDTAVGVKLDENSKTYRQVLPNGQLDMGEKGQIYVAVSAQNMFFEYTLEQLALGKVGSVDIGFTGLEGIAFFDFTNEGGEDYTAKILEYVEKAKAQEGELKGYVVADQELVEIIRKAMARIDHTSENSWLGFAFYYQHLGDYKA